jgi:hypothetical protein
LRTPTDGIASPTVVNVIGVTGVGIGLDINFRRSGEAQDSRTQRHKVIACYNTPISASLSSKRYANLSRCCGAASEGIPHNRSGRVINKVKTDRISPLGNNQISHDLQSIHWLIRLNPSNGAVDLAASNSEFILPANRAGYFNAYLTARKVALGNGDAFVPLVIVNANIVDGE